MTENERSLMSGTVTGRYNDESIRLSVKGFGNRQWITEPDDEYSLTVRNVHTGELLADHSARVRYALGAPERTQCIAEAAFCTSVSVDWTETARPPSASAP